MKFRIQVVAVSDDGARLFLFRHACVCSRLRLAQSWRVCRLLRFLHQQSMDARILEQGRAGSHLPEDRVLTGARIG